MKVRKIYFLLGIVLLALILIGGFFFLNGYIYNKKQAKEPNNLMPYRGTLTGEFVCLPHVDQNGPQTLECALGLKTDSGEYYALDFNQLPLEQTKLKNGDRFSASGLITPKKNLSFDQWQKYPIAGIFSIHDSIQQLDK